MPHYIINARYSAHSLGVMQPEELVAFESWLRGSVERLNGRLMHLLYQASDYALIVIVEVPDTAPGVLVLAMAQLEVFETGISVSRALLPSEMDGAYRFC